jgi:chromosome segregation ATPase
MDHSTLINTDIDRLCRLLEKGGRLEFGDIGRELGMPLGDVKRWALVLEDEGYVEIEYGLSKTYLIWTGPKEHKKVREEIMKVSISDEVVGDIPLRLDLAGGPHRIASEMRKMERVEEKVERKVEKAGKKEKERRKGKAVAAPKRVPVEEEEVKREAYPVISKIGEIREEVSLEQIEPLKIRRPKVFTELSSFSTKLKERMDSVNAMCDEIEKLKSKKEELLREVYDPLEKKFGSELDAISDKLVKNERMILNLQQRALNMPEEVEGIEKQLLKIQEIEKEARNTFDDVNGQMGESLRELASLQHGAEGKLETAKRNIYAESAALDEMDRTLSRINAIEGEARETIDGAVARMSEEGEYIEKVGSALGELEKMKRTLNNSISALRENVSAQKASLNRMEEEISKIAVIDGLVEKYKDGYVKKVEELSGYIREGEREYETLREAVEANFVGRYLKDLNDITSSYEFELGEAKKVEKSIDEKIDEKKKDLNELLRQGRGMAGMLKEKKAAAKPVALVEVVEKREKMLQAFEEKKKERKEITGRIDALTKKEHEEKQAKKGKKKG